MSARAFTILDAISDQRLFGAAFRDLSTWRACRAFLAGLFGIAMSEAQAEVYRACTGRSGLPDSAFPRGVAGLRAAFGQVVGGGG